MPEIGKFIYVVCPQWSSFLPVQVSMCTRTRLPTRGRSSTARCSYDVRNASTLSSLRSPSSSRGCYPKRFLCL